MVRVGINGFGEMGRYFLRANQLEKQKGAIGADEVDIVAVNDLNDLETLTRLTDFSTIYGNFPGTVEQDGKDMIIDGKRISVSSERDPNNLNWGDIGVDVIYDATGLFVKPGATPVMQETIDQYIEGKAGAQKLVFSAPSKHEGVVTLVMGVNNEAYQGQDLISNASCTTNCLAPVAYVLNEEFGINSGYMLTIHAYTGDQRLIDSPHSDPSRGYSVAENLIPTKTGAAEAVGKVIPELEGILSGQAVRTDNQTGSLVHLVVQLDDPDVTVEQINTVMQARALGDMNGTLKYSDKPYVGKMSWGEPTPSIFDPHRTAVVGPNTSVMTFYDNISGYSHQANKLMHMIHQDMKQK